MGTVERNAIVALVSQNTLFRAGLASLLMEMELGEIVQAASLNRPAPTAGASSPTTRR